MQMNMMSKKNISIKKQTTIALMVLVLAGSMTFLPESKGNVPEDALDAVICTDQDGVWNVPDGLIFGGPRDNSHEPQYSLWLEVCDFQSEHKEAAIFVPFEEVKESWMACHDDYRSAISDLSQDQANNSKMPSHQDYCGPRPDESDTLSNGTIRVDVPYMHIGSPEGSISFSDYIYKDQSIRKDPVNLVFYDGTELVSHAMVNSHWSWPSNHHSGDCSSQKWAYILDAQHGGTDSWRGQMHVAEAHHGSNCLSPRYHIRFFAEPLLDTHSGGFGYYRISAVHYEEWWHFESGVNPLKGVNHVNSDFSSASWWLSSYLHWAGNTDCPTCGNHDGYIRFVRVADG